MATGARIGHSVVFQTESATPGVYDDFAEITNNPFPSISRDIVDGSHAQSPEEWREKIGGLKDGGELSFEFNLVPGGASFSSLFDELALTGGAEVKNRRIVFPNGYYLQFAAIFSGMEGDLPIDDRMTGTANFAVSGKPTLNAPA